MDFWKNNIIYKLYLLMIIIIREYENCQKNAIVCVYTIAFF